MSVPDAYDECANCGTWHYTHVGTGCKRFRSLTQRPLSLREAAGKCIDDYDAAMLIDGPARAYLRLAFGSHVAALRRSLRGQQ